MEHTRMNRSPWRRALGGKSYEPEFASLHPQVRHTAQRLYDASMESGRPRAEAVDSAIARAKKHAEANYGIKEQP